MGQKVHPTGIRLGIVKDHASVWYADKKSYPEYLLNDLEVRDYLRKRLAQASVSRIEIERPAREGIGCACNSRARPTIDSVSVRSSPPSCPAASHLCD